VIRLVQDSQKEAFYVWNEIDQGKVGFNKQNYKVTERAVTSKILASQSALLVGNKKGLTRKKCFVEINSPQVINLTVVDLPGLGILYIRI